MVPPRITMSRRGFLGRSALAGLGALGGGALLEACAPALAGSGTVPLPRPNNPVTWPLFPDNQAIKSGLAPETGATLQIYNWVAYVNQSCLNSFAKKYNCKVELTTFNTMNEALSKLRSGLSYDVFMGVTVDTLGQLIESKLIQPLNHSYIPNIEPGLARLHQPLLRPGLAVHGAVHDLHHGHLVAEGPGPREPVHDAEPLGDALAAEVQGQGRDPRRLPREPSASG